MACVDTLVTATANDQRFALACRHLFDPGRLFPTPGRVQIRQLANVMDLAVRLRSTQLALLGEKTLNKFRAAVENRLGLIIECYFQP